MKRLFYFVIFLLPFFIHDVHAGSSDLDSTNPTYNRAVNPIVAPAERLAALESLFKQKGFEEMENLFTTLLHDKRQPVLIKNFIVHSAGENASTKSPIHLQGMLQNKTFDTETRRLALWALWKAEKVTVSDLEGIIRDPEEDLAFREYAVSLLREKSGYFERESRRIMEDLATGPATEPSLQMQAIGALSQDLDNPQTLGFFQRLAQDQSMPETARRLLLLNIKAQDQALSTQMNRQILLDTREPVDLRIFAFEIMPDEVVLEHLSEMRQLEFATTEMRLKTVLAERLNSLKK